MGRTYAWLAVIIVLVVTAHVLWGADVSYVREDTPLGTAGALRETALSRAPLSSLSSRVT